jgi:hypothetical protein
MIQVFPYEYATNQVKIKQGDTGGHQWTYTNLTNKGGYRIPINGFTPIS